VRPVERRTPARNADTATVSNESKRFTGPFLPTQHCIEGIMGDLAELRKCELLRCIGSRLRAGLGISQGNVQPCLRRV
jgi:hypothetical protein